MQHFYVFNGKRCNIVPTLITIMIIQNQISVKQFAKEADISTKHVYYLGKCGRIKIREVAGFKVIDKTKYHPFDFQKKL